MRYDVSACVKNSDTRRDDPLRGRGCAIKKWLEFATWKTLNRDVGNFYTVKVSKNFLSLLSKAFGDEKKPPISA
jgi:hypothetical protein